MSTIYSGSALQGTGSLINEELGTSISSISQNAITITNTGEPNYVTIYVEDGVTEYFNTGSKLILTPFSNTTADGEIAESTAAALSMNDGDWFGWSRGRVEYRFYATSSSPLPSDNVEYLSPDNQSRRYNYFCEYESAAGDMARNLTDKINDVNIDGLEEINAAFTNLGFVNLKTSLPTTKYNNMPMYITGTLFATLNGNGRNPYTKAGGKLVNGHGKVNVTTPYIPFIAENTHVAFIVPNTDSFKNERLEFTFAATNGTIAANTFRVQAAGGADTLSVEVFGE